MPLRNNPIHTPVSPYPWSKGTWRFGGYSARNVHWTHWLRVEGSINVSPHQVAQVPTNPSLKTLAETMGCG